MLYTEISRIQDAINKMKLTKELKESYVFKNINSFLNMQPVVTQFSHKDVNHLHSSDYSIRDRSGNGVLSGF